jgi:hypothetical protein
MMCQFLWKEANPDKKEDDYDEYRRSYGLNYVRTFFNEHMDDSWYRSLYSPLGKYRVALQERERAAREATQFQTELAASLKSASEKDGRCYFVLKSRLGGGVKQPRRLPGDDYHNSAAKGSSKSPSISNPVPSTHVLALASQVLPILDVPAYVTDEQLTVALMNHCSQDMSKTKSLVLYSSTPATDLSRTAYLYAPEDIRKDIIHQLNHLDRGNANATKGGAAAAAHVPRKEETYVPKTLELEVECSDAYGREEIDADGKGGAPAEEGGVPSRKASVWVSTQAVTPNVLVLSAAVSSRQRIAQDQTAALKLAKAYDAKRNIPAKCRLEALLPKAIPSVFSEDDEGSIPQQDLEDALDLSIAYMRRVHLFSFYNGCATASNVADVFRGKHATSTIHLRSANADDILQENKKDERPAAAATIIDNPAAKVDLLVQRLNDSIQKALEETSDWVEDSMLGTAVVTKEIDSQARDIEQQEALVEDVWIEDHALIDEDGRARCAFHSCRKLFKDHSFLSKHLIKKHSEFLRAEVAKCHDGYMMKAWDAQEVRPVPSILVDCGRAFKVVPSPVLGSAVPLAADPEPELWRRQEERRKQEEEEAETRRERYQQHHNHRDHHNHGGGGPPDLDGPLSEDRGPPAPRHSNFVDVDDMKEEKIEMAFDAVEIPVEAPKKKKKKRKLL